MANNSEKKEIIKSVIVNLKDLGLNDDSSWYNKFPEPYSPDKVYDDIVREVVNISKTQLGIQSTSKEKLKTSFSTFFKILLSAQLIFLALLIVYQAFFAEKRLSDAVIISYISSVFVETLGGVILMITYAFNSKEEVETIRILNRVVQYYQKSPHETVKPKTKNKNL